MKIRNKMFKLTIVPIIINIFCCHAAAAVGAGLLGKSKSFLLKDNVEKESAILKKCFRLSSTIYDCNPN